ncbi:WXG100 family type VII secretion target [Luedemannella flava]
MNPLVAARVDGEVKPWTGIWLAEDIELLVAGVRSNNWVDISLGAIGTTLDGLAFVSDPASSLLQYGLSWMLEQVAPLRDALDWLAGDAAQIAAHAATWRNIAADVRASASTLSGHVRVDVAGWGGTAGPAYRTWSGEQSGALSALARAADAMAVITEAAGFVVSAVRAMVRDAIAVVVSRMIVYATEEVFSLGFATPLVVEQVSTLVAAWSAKIAKWLRGLITSLNNLIPAVRHLNTLIDKIKENLGRRPRHAPDGDNSSKPTKIGGPKEFDPQELRGLTPDEVKARIPDDWERKPSAKGGGELFVDPVNKGRQIRIMPGYPPHSRPDPMTWGPYVVVSQGGNKPVKIPLDGNPEL